VLLVVFLRKNPGKMQGVTKLFKKKLFDEIQNSEAQRSKGAREVRGGVALER